MLYQLSYASPNSFVLPPVGTIWLTRSRACAECAAELTLAQPGCPRNVRRHEQLAVSTESLSVAPLPTEQEHERKPCQLQSLRQFPSECPQRRDNSPE